MYALLHDDCWTTDVGHPFVPCPVSVETFGARDGGRPRCQVSTRHANRPAQAEAEGPAVRPAAHDELLGDACARGDTGSGSCPGRAVRRAAVERALAPTPAAGCGRALPGATSSPSHTTQIGIPEAWVTTDGSVVRTAEVLIRHRNTVLSRLRRIHTITGHDITNCGDHVELSVALCLLRLLGASLIR
ncbi:helix-turn-helix domain-containing protein [Streptomyces sp. NPDC058239]|uniref:helix-turn-helix domain-containing protein n=1 Tax=unclassified Streptomyces TaxID=2593676 RepID=UPI00365A1AA5